MRIISSIVFILVSIYTMAQSTSIYDYSFTDIDGNEVKMDAFKGKKILIVNVASKCGFTPQYEPLQQLHEQYGDKVVLIGFPCNQFLKQELGTEEEIKDFCQKNYGVDFLMASKIDVKGKDQHPIYQWLTTKALNNVEDTKVGWNFQKYLIGEDGAYIKMIETRVDPMSQEVVDLLK